MYGIETCSLDQCNDCKQLLYPACCGVDSVSLKCCNTVSDIFSDTSLCPKHSSEAVPSAAFKRKAPPHMQSRIIHKKVKVGVAKVARDRKGAILQAKV